MVAKITTARTMSPTLATDGPTRTVPVQPLCPQHEGPEHRVRRDARSSDP